ncbi:MAG: alpha/beta hydrolase [Candidatus Binataceae bacterium]
MATNQSYAIEVADVEYLNHNGQPLLARLFKPQGAGPFPTIVEVHGGAWCLMDRKNDAPVNEPLARSGVIVVALDFRMPPVAPYPASMADINYGIRWAKRHVGAFGGRPDWVGVMGSSSGGHQAMLAAMRPADPRYSSIPLKTEGPQVDATVNCVVMLWPVIDPLGRYQYAKALHQGQTLSGSRRFGAATARQVLEGRGRDGGGQSNPGARTRRARDSAALPLRAGRA